MQNFRDLKIWQRAHALTLAIYRATASFPDTERFGLTSQMRRAASSIGANIAEGAGRGSNADFARFLYNAMGSASELENFLLLGRDLELIGKNGFEALSNDVDALKRMLATFIGRVRSSD
jgi:four helix bundle protein